PAASPLPAPPSGGRVLVVDDDALVRSVLVELVADLGYETSEADGVASGLAVYRASRVPFACALIDLAMPGGGGAALLAELRRLAPRLPIVLMSGFAESEAVAAVQSGGVAPPFLQKPFGRAQLADVLVDAILTGGVPPAPRSDDPA
ncbi:MAG: response regulator, partial [Myxococcota bacterium]